MATKDTSSLSSDQQGLNHSPNDQPEKKGWDKASVISQVIGALAIPISIIVLIVQIGQFNTQQQSNSQTAMKQFQQTEQLAQNQQYQTTLDTYLDRMSDLLLKSNLAVSKPGDEVQALAEARTLTAVRNLDGLRKGTLIRFLWEAKLINRPQPIINLNGANLSEAIFSGGSLNLVGSIHLPPIVIVTPNGPFISTGAILQDVNLSGAILEGAYLIGADLDGADLSYADLKGAHLSGARYNTKTIQFKDTQGKTFILEPTLWPKGFDPKAAGASCDDC
jgi:uncharacterized protein YjbI with pentapeptide repeats